MALVQCPDILLDPSKQDALRQLYPGDAIQRAKEICENVTSLGAYSHSKGIPFIRKNVAEFIERRDGYPSDPECIFLTDGASDGIKRILNLLIRDDNDGVQLESTRSIYFLDYDFNPAIPSLFRSHQFVWRKDCAVLFG